MKTWKQALALVLALVMALSLVALPSFAEGEETGGGTESTQPVWPAEGSIKLDKDAKAVEGQENLWEVTLGIQGRNYKTTSDVVLVIDNSNSMYEENGEKNDRMVQTKAAANAFIDKLLTEDSTTRIAVVVFNLKVDQTGFYTWADKAELKTYINNIKKATDKYDGGTFTQLGIKTARDLLNSLASKGGNKSIVLLSDGVPTASYRVSGTATGTCYNYYYGQNYSHNYSYDENTVVVTGCDYKNQAGNGRAETDGRIDLTLTCEHGETRTLNRAQSINHSYATVWEAGQALQDGITVYSVALQAGTEGETILKNCATNPSTGFFAIDKNESDIASKLTAAFTTIAGSIAIAASNGSVADTMGKEVQLSFSGAAPVITTDKAVYDAGKADVYISQGSATYDTTNRRINWTVGNVREGDNPIMKYKVTVKEGCNPSTGEVLDANESATFSYKNYLGVDTVGTFPVPQVTVGGGNILVHYYLVNDQGQPINENGTVVGSPALAKQVKTAAYFEADGSTGLKYNNSYTVSYENVANYNYFGSYILNDSNLTKGNSVDVTLTAANSNQHVWFAYYQTFNVVHVRMDKSGNAQQVGEIDTYPVSQSFNLTDKVNKKADGSAVTEGGFLYGGAFKDADCTTAYPFADGETGLSFVPQAGATYYIWEVPDAYLKPVTLSCWEHNTNGKLDVIGFYMVSGIDREYYKQVGFMLNSAKTVADQRTLTYQDNTTKVVQLTSGQSAAFEQIVLKQKDGNTRTYNVSNAVKGYDKGYMVCYGVEQGVWKIVNAENTYSPYWITLDGVKVTSATARTVKYQGEGSSRLNYSEKSDNVGYEAASVSAETQLLTLASYCADGTPITADVPTVENVTVTVVDAAKTYELTVSAGTGIRDQVAYQAPAGKVFAGWFADQAYTTPADLDQVTQDTTIYAKYVSDSYLDLNYSRIGLFRLRGVTLISAVDNPANYQASGFIVGDQKVDASYASRYRIFKTPANLFGAARDAKLMLADKSLSGTGDLEVTPYWITLDGTEVHGVTHTLHYNTRTIWE